MSVQGSGRPSTRPRSTCGDDSMLHESAQAPRLHPQAHKGPMPQWVLGQDRTCHLNKPSLYGGWGGGRLKPEGPWDCLGGRVGREGDLVQEGQLQGLWLVCLPSETGNKVTVSAPGRERQRQSRGGPSPISVGVDTTPDYAFLIPASRGIWASHCLPNKSQQTSI